MDSELWLQKYGKQIGSEARSGNKYAQDIVTYYTMLHKCPGDNCSSMLLENAIGEYIKNVLQKKGE